MGTDHLKELFKEALKEVLKERLEISVDVWESDGRHLVKATVEFDGEVIAEHDDTGW